MQALSSFSVATAVLLLVFICRDVNGLSKGPHRFGFGGAAFDESSWVVLAHNFPHIEYVNGKAVAIFAAGQLGVTFKEYLQGHKWMGFPPAKAVRCIFTAFKPLSQYASICRAYVYYNGVDISVEPITPTGLVPWGPLYNNCW